MVVVRRWRPARAAGWRSRAGPPVSVGDKSKEIILGRMTLSHA